MTVTWEREISSLGPREHIEAVGALALFYNRMEFGLWKFFRHYLPLNAEAISLLFSTLNNRERVDLVRQFGQAEKLPELANAIDHALQCYDICVENRNLVLHALPGFNHSGPEIMELLKASKLQPNLLKRYHFTLDSIRDAGMAMEAICDFMDRIYMFMTKEVHGGQIVVTTLPEKPQKPRTLSLSQLRATDEAAPRPPPASGG